MPALPPPEAVLLRARRQASGLSIRAAARKAGVSETLWRRIEYGHMVEAGAEQAAVRGTAGKVAAMAAALDVTAAELAGCGRADAAAALEARGAAPVGVGELLEALDAAQDLSTRSKRIVRGVIEALAREEGDPDGERRGELPG